MFTKFANWIVDQLIPPGKRRRGIYWAIFLFVIFPIVILATFSYIRTRDYLTDATLSRRESIAYLAATTLQEKFDHLIDVGISLATRVRFRQLITEGQWDEAIGILKDVPEDLPVIERLFLADPSGTLMVDAPALPDVRGKNFAFRDWYQGVSANWQPHLSEIYKRTAKPQYNVIAVAVPIESEAQKILGILVLQIRLDTLLEWSRGIQVGPSGFVYFVDRKGLVAGHPNFPPQGDIVDFSAAPAAQKALGGQRGIEILFDSIENEERIVAYEPLTKYGWGVIVQQPTKAAFTQRNNELKLIAIIYSLLILLNAFLVYLILRTLQAINSYRQKENIILESVGDGLVVIDRYWNILLWNKAAARISGWSKEEALGRPVRNFLKFIKEADRSENIVFIEEAMLFGRVGYLEDKTVLITKDGGEIPTGDSAAPIFDYKDKAVGAVIIFRDVSEEREAQLLRSDFAYASHQLRTPVNKALWIIESALEEKDHSETKKKIKTVYTSIKSVAKLVEQMLTVSEIDQGTVIPKTEKVILTSLLDEALKLIKYKAEERNITITITPISSLVSIDTDPKLLQKALLEILDNSILYSPSSSKIEVNIAIQQEALMIEIKDNGVGISESQQPLIFTKFFRGSNIDTTEIIGAGLGLFICREYVKLLKGKIWFKSEEGKGTTFSILLPIKGS